jgi:GT2 family glycosyltransferase
LYRQTTATDGTDMGTSTEAPIPGAAFGEQLVTVHDDATVAVVIPCYSENRWETLLVAVSSASGQTRRPDRIIVVVDHNEQMYQRLVATELTGVDVLQNTHDRGAGGARNTGAMQAGTDYVAFLDDDIRVEPDWLERLLEALAMPGFVGAGGALTPSWEVREPWWLPQELGWVVGSRGGEQSNGQTCGVRNVWASNMIVDGQSFVAAGGFLANFGKVGTRAEPEDTELCIRLSRDTNKTWAFTPAAVAYHHVPAAFTSYRYFLRRCWAEGRGKAALRERLSRSGASLSAEKTFLSSTLPLGLAAYGKESLRGRPVAVVRAANLLVGTFITCVGFTLATGTTRRTT